MAPSAEIIDGTLFVIGGGLGVPMPLTAESFVAELPK